MREQQRRAVGAVSLLVLVSTLAGTAVAVVTAKRLSDPLRDVAGRAARLAEGDFRPDARRHHIPELDRVSDVLDSATVEIAGRLQREHLLVADVSHQLRSRLTAGSPFPRCRTAACVWRACTSRPTRHVAFVMVGSSRM